MTESKAKAFLTNFGHKIFHTVGDADTAQYASSLLGHRREAFVTVSPKPGLSMGEEMFGNSGASCSINESYHEVLQPITFLSGLLSGGPQNGYLVTGIVIRSGEPFRNGQNWQRVSFSQR